MTCTFVIDVMIKLSLNGSDGANLVMPRTVFIASDTIMIIKKVYEKN